MPGIFTCDKNFSEKLLNHFQDIFTPRFKDFEEEISTTYIGKNIYQKHVVIEELEVVIRLAQSEWFHLQSVMLNDNLFEYSEMIYSRNIINDTFFAISDCIQLCECSERKERYMTAVARTLDHVSKSVVSLSKFQDEFVMKISPSAINDTKCPIFQYFHTFLDVHYHLIALGYICGSSKEKIEGRVINVLKDLIVISKMNYKRQNTQNQQAFLCNCVEKFWLILQLFIEKIDSDDRNCFWNIFNKLLEKEDPAFTLWLLKYVAFLQSFNGLIDNGNNSDRITPNYVLLESKLKDLLLNAESATVLNSFKVIEPLLCNLWLKKAQIEVFQIIWDHYSKRLNISNKKLPQSALEFNDKISTVLSSPINCNEDFDVFVSMLLVHLREYPLHWGKMKGRIYCQLGPNKIRELNEIGVTHVMVLFISLTNVNLSELSKKIITFVKSLPSDKKFLTLNWNAYTVFLIRHVLEGEDIESLALLMLEMLHEAVNDQKLFRLVKDFVENFEHIVNYSTNYQLHQWLLIDSWLSKYLVTCYHSDLKIALGVLLSTLNQVRSVDSWSLWEPAFRDCVYPSLKQIANSATAPDIIGKIAGKLCVLTPAIANDAFIFFTSDTIPPKVSCQFLCEILADFPNNFILTSSQESMVLQSWVKICFLTTDFSEDLMKNIMKLDCFPTTLKSHIATSQDPIYALIEYLGCDIKQHIQSNNIIKLCETCFGQSDKWLLQYLSQPGDEAVVLRVYTCVSLAFLHCGPLLYDRNKSTSPLTRLVQVLLLPTDFLIGKKVPHNFVLNAAKKTWHIFFEAIVKLNSDNDTFLERTLRDMIQRYMQYFPTADSPIIKCLENSVTAPVILDKISNAYLKHPVKESDTNILKVLKLLSDFVQSTTSLPLMKLIINKCLYGLFEVVVFHSQRNVALSVIKVLTCSPLYPQVRDEFNSAVLAVTEKHLAFNTINYFQLMYILAKFIPGDIQKLLPNIKQHICNVERMRGVGFDKNLRAQFEKLESTVEIPK